MLKVYSGKEYDQRKKSLNEYVSSLGEVSLERFELSNILVSSIEEFIATEDLFGKLKVGVLDLDNAQSEIVDEVISKAKQFSQSKNILIIESNEINSVRKKKLEKHGDYNEFNPSGKVARLSPLAFKITDAFLVKDKKKMWSYYREAISLGEEVEQIQGALMWQIKCLALVCDSQDQSSSTLSGYVYSKSKQALRFFTRGDISRYALELMILAHKSREEGGSIEEELERWMLSI